MRQGRGDRWRSKEREGEERGEQGEEGMNPAVGGAHDEPSGDNENELHYRTGLSANRATSSVRSGSRSPRVRMREE